MDRQVGGSATDQYMAWTYHPHDEIGVDGLVRDGLSMPLELDDGIDKALFGDEGRCGTGDMPLELDDGVDKALFGDAGRCENGDMPLELDNVVDNALFGDAGRCETGDGND
ncbi:hypothetical protein GW17_00008031 [Ensete ventricosum]|nr:hypothetical protein GW17_00008031 [Ensete ventricosum]